MKRGTVIAIAVLAVLAVVYFATSSSPRQTERAPLTIEKVESLDRIEIQPPKGGASSGSADAGAESDSGPADKPKETVVLEKRDGDWWVTKPVESPAASAVGGDIEDLFGSAISTDALDLGSDKAEYGVGAADGVRLSLFGGGSKKPAVELVVGEQIDIQKTDAKRTFIRQAGASEIYRAQAAIGEFVRQSVDEFRSDEIVDIDSKNLTRLQWKHADGTTIVLERDKKTWKMLRPQVEWSLDSGAIDSIASSLGGLTADDFADDKSASEIGLKKPAVRLEYTVREGGDGKGKSKKKGSKTTGTLLVGKVGDGEEPAYYAKRGDEPFQYKLSKYAGEQLVATLGDLRSKTPRTFDKKAITEVQFPGDAGVVVRKQEGSWSIVRPSAEKSLNKAKLDPKLSTVAELSVTGFPDIEPAEAGLTAGANPLTFEMKNGDRHTILFGDKVEKDGGDRYVKFADGDEVFTISKFNYDKLHPKVDDLVGEKKGGPGKGLGKGMGKGMGKGSKMQRLKKMRMMQKLKRRMRRKR